MLDTVIGGTAAVMGSPWTPQLDALGGYLREQRRQANLSLRELAALSQLSNAYLSQLERGRHEPSVRVLRSLSSALDVSLSTLLAQVGLLDDGGASDDPPPRSGASDDPPPRSGAVEEAIRDDPRLGERQKDALLAVYLTLVSNP